MKLLACLMIACTGFLYSQSGRDPDTISLDELVLEPGIISREIAYTNKEAGVYYTETHDRHRNGWQGWRVMSHEIMEDYVILLDGASLRQSSTASIALYPHQLIRRFNDGVVETMTLLDSINALVIELKLPRPVQLIAAPAFQDVGSSDDVVTKFNDQTLLIARKSHLQRTGPDDYPAWIAVRVQGEGLPAELTSMPDSSGTGFVPGAIQLPSVQTQATVIITAGDSEEDALMLARKVGADYPSRIAHRKSRLESLLNASYIRTDNTRLDRALQWAKLSLDALIMHQVKKGIFAGLPWFDNYWGRDSFIALPGATLVTGNFADGKAILRSFAEWQERREESTDFGRIPNLVTTKSMAYNTADGTPRFVIALRDYVRSSGDLDFARELFPVVRRSIEGTVKYHTDADGFLTHADAETWMDAVGPNGAWSPRGNRANDIQALWCEQLKAAGELASFAGNSDAAEQWNARAGDLKKKFIEKFLRVTDPCIIDHLTPDGTQDLRVRPNQLFALPMIDNDSIAAEIFKRITGNLVYPYGVASLSQVDPDFHPFHHFAPYYVQDAAYHNGVVWTWLAGPWIDQAVRFRQEDLAFTLTERMSEIILERGAAGTLPELLDAASRPGEDFPRLSGAYSQAWSLAEYVRNVYQSYLGLSVNVPEHSITIRPRMPGKITRANVRVPMGASSLYFDYNMFANKGWLTVESPPSGRDVTLVLDWGFKKGTSISGRVILRPNTKIKIALRENGIQVEEGGVPTPCPATVIPAPSYLPRLTGLKYAVPHVDSSLAAFRPPSHRMLSHREIKANGRTAKPIYTATDPEGDDVGPGTYRYPTSPYFRPGSLDITSLDVSADQSNVYVVMKFRSLSDPGWHPEYGFQLTFVALALDTGTMGGVHQRRVGQNSGYTFDESFEFDKIIYVGGGIRVCDAAGTTLAEYLPAPEDVKNPLGKAEERTISFAVPREILGKPSPSWRFAALVGAQDDHGGAGVGEFRAVAENEGEWTGGGKKNLSDPNVYDTLLPSGKK